MLKKRCQLKSAHGIPSAALFHFESKNDLEQELQGNAFLFFGGGGGQKLNLRKMYSFYKLCWLITVQYYLLPRASFFPFGNPENELCSRKLGV